MNKTDAQRQKKKLFKKTPLAYEQLGKFEKAAVFTFVFVGEKLNLIAGSLPLGNEGVKERFKLGILQ